MDLLLLSGVGSQKREAMKEVRKMRNMSFSLTTRQFLDGSKTVTRRVGWNNLKPGERFMAVEKAMGLRKGEKVKRLGECVCVSKTAHQLVEMFLFPGDCEREGFPEMEQH
jgi:hypothetical protein